MSDDVQLRIVIVMAGQLIEASDGTQSVATQDSVIIQPIVDGVDQRNYIMTPDEALAVASALSQAAGTVIAQQVDDDGNKPGLLARLERLNRGLS